MQGFPPDQNLSCAGGCDAQPTGELNNPRAFSAVGTYDWKLPGSNRGFARKGLICDWGGGQVGREGGGHRLPSSHSSRDTCSAPPRSIPSPTPSPAAASTLARPQRSRSATTMPLAATGWPTSGSTFQASISRASPMPTSRSRKLGATRSCPIVSTCLGSPPCPAIPRKTGTRPPSPPAAWEPNTRQPEETSSTLHGS